MRLAALPLIALALTACGSSAGRLSKAEYTKRLQEIERRDETATSPFFDIAGHDLPLELCVRETRDLQRAVQKIVDDARALKPPAELARYHEDFLVNAQQSVDAVGAAADKVQNGKLRCGDEMNRAIYGMPSTDRAEKALQDLADHGVPLCITTCE
ncbi:MAG: hypothetical protein QOE91_481 [Gaiellaceae bacterium]|jgi:hypothetical protein|nr:hypothetical protein [Gaiellaceae bacterium]